MMREQESRLLEFCVAQRQQFDAAAWPRFSAVTPLELAATVRYLAGVSWYGHQAQLKAVADQLSPDAFPALVQQTRFEPSRFRDLLKAHLRHAGQPVEG